MYELDSECFPIGLCDYPAQIEYEFDEGDVVVHKCMIEVAGGDNPVWARVDPEYFPVIERQLKQELEEAADEAIEQHDIEWHGNKAVKAYLPAFLQLQAETQKQLNKIDDQINSLLAITHDSLS